MDDPKFIIHEVVILKIVFGIIILALAVLSCLAVFRFIKKRGVYKNDLFGLFLDSIEFLSLIIALVLIATILITGK